MADQPMYVTWDDDRGRARALHQAGEALKKVEPVLRTHGSEVFLNVAGPSVSVRDGFSRRDFDDFRPDQRLPHRDREVVRSCMRAYKHCGIVRNVVDLMGDFATQGIDLVHPNERIEKWWKEWFRRVKGKDRSERFLNLLYRAGGVVVQRRTTRLPVEVEDEMRRARADADLPPPEPARVAGREIPWRYTLRSPLGVEVIEDDLTLFVGEDNFAFAVKVPQKLAAKIREPRTAAQKRLVARLPAEVVRAVRQGVRLIPLDPEKVRAFYYKKDDDEVWASPMLEAILPDLQVLQKMKLADLAALDGAISCIRVWKLGDRDNRILPGPAAIQRLAEILCNNVGGGVMDLVWDFAIDLVETKTDVHHFLGNTKYEPTLTSIYAGLGVPPTLTGAAGQNGSFTNNFISLKTLTERLQYGRDVLTAFWEEELALVQKAMPFRFPARVVFDRMVLTDEAAEKALLVQLWDRNLISDESIQERFGEVPEIEEVRGRREWRKRQRGDLPEKASPYHVAEKDHELKKLFVSSGTVTPSEVGVELGQKKKGEESALDRQETMTVEQTKLQTEQMREQNSHQFRTEKLQLEHGVHPGQLQKEQLKGRPGQGRPKNSKDARKRKQKRVVPRTAASSFLQTMAWAEAVQARIGQLAGQAYLGALGKKTMRELTDQEARDFEGFRFHALCQLSPGQEVDGGLVKKISSSPLKVPRPVAELLKATVAKHAERHGQAPPVEVLRRYQAGAVALWHSGNDQLPNDQ